MSYPARAEGLVNMDRYFQSISPLSKSVKNFFLHFSVGILQKGMKYTVRVTVKNSASPQVGTAETTFSVLTGITSCELNVPTSYTHLESVSFEFHDFLIFLYILLTIKRQYRSIPLSMNAIKHKVLCLNLDSNSFLLHFSFHHGSQYHLY